MYRNNLKKQKFGNGLSHLLFLPQSSYVIEIFPPSGHQLDYRFFANARKLDYTGIICNRGILEDAQAYASGPFGNANGAVNTLDINLIVNLIKDRQNK